MIGDSVAYGLVRIPTLLWETRHVLAKAGISPMPQAPWHNRSAHDVALDLSNKDRGWIPPIPTEVIIPIVNKAAWMLDLPAEDVIQLQDICLSAHNRKPSSYRTGSGTSQTQRNTRTRNAAIQFIFSTPEGSNSPWREALKEEMLQPRGNGSLGLESSIGVMKQVRRLVISVRDAAAVVLLACTGMRVSELCGIQAGLNSQTGLPNCVRIERSPTGLNELFFISAPLSKTEVSPREVDWLLGMRQIGDSNLPITVRALIIVNKLLQPYREISGIGDLFLSLGSMGLPKSSEAIYPIMADTFRESIRYFISDWVDLSALPNQSAHPIEENDLIPYRESGGKCIGLHQFRKSFANFVFAVDSRLLPVIALQFQHLSLAMTETGYLGKNLILFEALDSVSKQQTALLMLEVATGKRQLAGNMGQFVEDKLMPELRETVKNLSTREGWREVMRFTEVNDLRTYSGPHGKCMPWVPQNMECHKLSGTVSWRQQPPNYSAREPSTCAGCRCFILDTQHKAFWTRRYVDSSAAYLSAEQSGEGAQFVIVKERARVAKSLLKRIGVDISVLDKEIADTINKVKKNERS